MSKWIDCCNRWFRTQRPKGPQQGRFTETHTCPTCGTPLDLAFECSYPDDSLTAGDYGEDINALVCVIVGIKDNEP